MIIRLIIPIGKGSLLTVPACLLLSICLFAAGCGEPQGETITVQAGEYGYENVPIAVRMAPERWEDGAAICLERDGAVTPGQIERRDDGSSYAWFLANVPAGETAIYHIAGNDRCEGVLYRWEESDDRTTTLTAGNSPMMRYVFPEYDPDDIEHTLKPFHHVFAPSGERLITKGVGGLYSHHRGIFYGYNRVRTGGESYDIWHARNGERSEHERFEREWNGPVFGGHELTILWKGYDGEPFAEETRRIRAYQLDGVRSIIDVETTLRSLAGEIELGGDLQHAGVQFRAPQYVADNRDESRYFRPEPWTAHPPDEELEDIVRFVDLPWNAFQFVVEGDPYSVVYFRHSDNPSGGQFSERLYGRFGEFVPYVIDEGQPLILRYRFLIQEGHEVDRHTLDAISAGFTVPE